MTGNVKSRVEPFFQGCKNNPCVCLAWPVLSVHSNDLRLRQVLCVGPSTVILSRESRKRSRMSLFWWIHAAVDLQTVALKHPWFHTCVINTNTLTTVKKYLWLLGIESAFRKGSVKLKQSQRAMLTLTFHVTFIRTAAILAGGLVSVQKNNHLKSNRLR